MVVARTRAHVDVLARDIDGHRSELRVRLPCPLEAEHVVSAVLEEHLLHPRSCVVAPRIPLAAAGTCEHAHRALPIRREVDRQRILDASRVVLVDVHVRLLKRAERLLEIGAGVPDVRTLASDREPVSCPTHALRTDLVPPFRTDEGDCLSTTMPAFAKNVLDSAR